jgi:hypothetical protein
VEGCVPEHPAEWSHTVVMKIAVGGDCEDSWRIRDGRDVVHL